MDLEWDSEMQLDQQYINIFKAHEHPTLNAQVSYGGYGRRLGMIIDEITRHTTAVVSGENISGGCSHGFLNFSFFFVLQVRLGETGILLTIGVRSFGLALGFGFLELGFGLGDFIDLCIKVESLRRANLLCVQRQNVVIVDRSSASLCTKCTFFCALGATGLSGCSNSEKTSWATEAPFSSPALRNSLYNDTIS